MLKMLLYVAHSEVLEFIATGVCEQTLFQRDQIYSWTPGPETDINGQGGTL